MQPIVYLAPALGVLALLYTAYRSAWVTRQDPGNERMTGIAGHIADGATAFLKAEYRVLALFSLIACAFLYYIGSNDERSSPLIIFAFLVGALFSALAGFIGMRIATKANVRTAHAARTSLSRALEVSFAGGSVMGMGVAGLAVLGLGGLFILFYGMFVDGASANGPEMERALEVLTGFSLGAESIALFARVGGGIYTKAADVGADLVGKVEAGIPEDDPRNPATIADNVGDNVGDVAGMGADLFGSYVATILATMVLGREVAAGGDRFGGLSPILLPMVLAGLGIVFSLIGILMVRVKEGGNVQGALNIGNWVSIALTGVGAFFLIPWMLPAGEMTLGRLGSESFDAMGVFWAVVVGLV
ncbi:MAG TPA: sodium/proton-translocating pyrophosphatase, partial [Longimicrobiaceae bacterium]|nr:sodium/proton-translocating pyrophosphatase [Longimicrobiaceae bacterium]